MPHKATEQPQLAPGAGEDSRELRRLTQVVQSLQELNAITREITASLDSEVVLERILKGRSVSGLVQVSDTSRFLPRVSCTFHGRDIFAPVAAHLANGVPMADLGPAIGPSSLVSGVVPRCGLLSATCMEGTVVAVDRFGNLLTNISASAIERMIGPKRKGRLVAEINDVPVGGWGRTYNQVPSGASLAVIGSRGLLEISVNCGNAQQVFKAGKGSRVVVRIQQGNENG